MAPFYGMCVPGIKIYILAKLVISEYSSRKT